MQMILLHSKLGDSLFILVKVCFCQVVSNVLITFIQLSGSFLICCYTLQLMLIQHGGIFTFRFWVEKLSWSICKNLSLYQDKFVQRLLCVYIIGTNVSAQSLFRVLVSQISMTDFCLKFTEKV